MMINILDPNREVDPRYEAFQVTNELGRSFSGILIADNTDTIELLQADGSTVKIDKREVEEVHATGRSLMPEGLERELTEQGIAGRDCLSHKPGS